MEEGRVDDIRRKGKVTFSDSARAQYAKSYGIVGNHSGVQICHWTKNALRGGNGCYKVKFYGVDCHRCCQVSPALAWCSEACVFCWRPMEWMKRARFEADEVDAPSEIIAGCVRERRKLMSGFGTFRDRGRFDGSFGRFPSHWAISLSGEPTVYPLLGGMVRELKANTEVRTIFIVTNGQEPERIGMLAAQDALPTQLYLSLAAADPVMFRDVNRSVYPDGWERLQKTIDLFPSLPCRRAIRLTLIKGVNDHDDALRDFASLIERSKADFVEVKSYMALGFSRRRLGVKNMLEHGQIMVCAKMLEGYLRSYSLVDDDRVSRIALLRRKDSAYPSII